MTPKRQKLVGLAQEYAHSGFGSFRPLAGYGLPPPPPGGILQIIFFLKPNVLQGFCNTLAL